MTISRIVSYDFDFIDFIGDFYPFENNNGNGVIMKIDSDGEEYKMCAEKCQCLVECGDDNDCGNNMECKEYVCVENMKKRRETVDKNERKVANVLVYVPLFLCTYGVFSSFFLAKEYGNRYFSDKCKDKCGISASESLIVDMDVSNVEKDDHEKSYYCSGNCILNNDQWKIKFEKSLNYVTKHPKLNLEFNRFFSFQKGNMKEVAQKAFDNAKAKCQMETLKDEISAPTLADALEQFAVTGQIGCGLIGFEWVHARKTVPGFGFLNEICDINESTVTCR